MGSHPCFAIASFPIQFAIPPIANVAAFVDQIDTWPHGIPPAFPVLTLVIHDDWELEFRLAYAFANFIDLFFCGGFWRVHADDCQPSICVVFMPPPVPGVVADAVHSAEGPEVQRDDFAFEVSDA